jgi:hypothetical protein
MKLGGHSYSFFGLSGFFLRLAAALFVVFATYNPSGFSYYHWVVRRWASDWPLQLPLLPVLVIAYLLLLRSTFRGLRETGVLLMVALLGALAWLLLDLRLIRISDGADLALVLLYMLAALLGIGVSWMWVWTRITGQVNYDDLTQ